MRVRFLFATAAMAALCTLSNPLAAQGKASVCTDGSTSTATGRGACSGHGGVDAKATAASKSHKKAMVACTDGTTSKGGRGACSSHGGIATAASVAPAPAPQPAPATPAARPPAPAPAPVPAPTPATARVRPPASGEPASNNLGGSGAPENNDATGAVAKCKDGVFSHSAHRTGTCSRHGGVAQWLVS